MKNKRIKTLFICGMVLPLLFSATACNKGGGGNDNPDPGPTETTKYQITYSSGDGYLVTGPSEVIEGASLTFTINVKDDYDATEMVVKANDEALVAVSDGVYQVNDVRSDLSISVSGVYKRSSISLSTSLFRFNLATVPEEAKESSYYLAGVTGSYHGESCAVQVDISEVDFTVAGSYGIVYTLVGHNDVTSYATVEIYELPTVEDATVDLSNYRSSIISYNSVGEVHVDFEVLDASKNELDSSKIAFDAETNANHFTSSYISTLSIGSPIQYYVLFDGEEIPFKVTITDQEELLLTYSMEEGEYAFLASDNAVLPYASLKTGSAQRAEITYTLNDVEVQNPAETKLSEAGEYHYTIHVSRGGEEIVGLARNYTFRIFDNYDIVEDIDLNSSFLFYNEDIFNRYFADTEVLSLNSKKKEAKINSENFTITNELITAAKTRGYKYMRISFDMIADNGEDITSIPFVSHCADEANDFWKRYWAQNVSACPNTIVLDLEQIDLEEVPDWRITFSFRTASSDGKNVKSTGTVSNILFSKTAINPNIGDETVGENWAANNGVLTNAVAESETKFSVDVNNISYSWRHVGFMNLASFIEEGYTHAIVSASGNNHNMFAYLGTALDINTYDVASKYQNRILGRGGGQTEIALQSGYSVLGVMTSHEIPLDDGGKEQDEEGVYGKSESFTLTVEFEKRETDIEAELFGSVKTASKYFVDCSISSVDKENRTISVSESKSNTISVGSGMLEYLKDKKETSFSFDFKPENTDVKTLVAVQYFKDGTYKYPLVCTADTNGVIKVSLNEDMINNSAKVLFYARGLKGYQDTDVHYNNAVISNVLFASSTPEYIRRFYSTEAWTSTNDSTTPVSTSSSFVATKTWLLTMNQSFASYLISLGYTTVSFDVTVANASLFLAVKYNGATKAETYNANGLYHLEITLASVVDSGLVMRPVTSSSFSDWSSVCAGETLTITNAVMETKEVGNVVKENARNSLSRIFESTSNSWKYIHHNGFGTNDWGENNDRLVLSTNNFFSLTNAFIADCKKAEYASVSFHVKADSTSGEAVSFLYAESDQTNKPFASMRFEGNDVDVTVDITAIPDSYTGAIAFYPFAGTESSARTSATFVISNISFAD